MPRLPRPEIRDLLIARAADMLARREPITLRSLVSGTDVSAMAVYTYFGSMPGLMSAVRQAGFERLARALASVAVTPDPVADLAAAGRAYVDSAIGAPHLYRAMFDTAAPLADEDAADRTFHVLHSAIGRAVEAGRFRPEASVDGIATQIWTAGHGVCNLVCTQVLPPEIVDLVVPPLLTALFVEAGDDRGRAAASFEAGWSRTT